MVSRVLDVLLAFPTLLFALALLAIFNQSPSFLGMSGQTLNFAVVIFVLGFFGFAYLARIVRGQVLSLREKEFVDAARSLGRQRLADRQPRDPAQPARPGAGVDHPDHPELHPRRGRACPSWASACSRRPRPGVRCSSTARQFFQNDPMFLVWPGMALFLTVLSFNLFGDGLRDALDPKSTR